MTCDGRADSSVISIVAAYRHGFSVRANDDASQSLARLLVAPALSALRRVWYQVHDRESGHAAASAEQVLAYLRRADAHFVGFDSGRSGNLVAAAALQIALPYTPDADVVAPFDSYVIVPYEEAYRDALVSVLGEIAVVLRAAWGMTTVEPSFSLAHRAAIMKGPPRDQRAAYPLLTDARVRYRRAPWFFNKTIDRVIGGPEWGTFLGPGHMQGISIEALRNSGAFHEVRPLAHGGAFVRLSEDPMDAQSPRILELVVKGRAALAPIVADVSAVKL